MYAAIYGCCRKETTMTVVDGDVFRVAARMSVGEDDVVNVFHLAVVTGGPQTDANAVTDILDRIEDIYSLIHGLMPDTQVFQDIKIDQVEYVSGEPRIVRNLGVYGWPTLTTGLSVAEELPAQISALCTFRTIQPKTLAKKYWGRMVETHWDGDEWDSTVMTGLGNVIAEMIVTWIGTYLNLDCFVQSKAATDFINLLSGAARAYAATQRRRKPGVGA
jgi:hypothetical protein